MPAVTCEAKPRRPDACLPVPSHVEHRLSKLAKPSRARASATRVTHACPTRAAASLPLTRNSTRVFSPRPEPHPSTCRAARQCELRLLSQAMPRSSLAVSLPAEPAEPPSSFCPILTLFFLIESRAGSCPTKFKPSSGLILGLLLLGERVLLLGPVEQPPGRGRGKNKGKSASDQK
ncbi:hypothetical protein E5676_scaffold184G00350 [Cucumis melo var. makuwa]|uniref:Uncharacterized protein n=1 Tax=Cucumis melo var. makuwa TaxID=1194695 RepID=A0A5A7V267_CUCMM|nr:hypothetical protein E6C27_scaffold108G001110 [Cucumis melo var. makuwa]TYK24790.1 hypothetical protein E5676_scaffold184G00350 [Cucumis melo var. makuwa]